MSEFDQEVFFCRSSVTFATFGVDGHNFYPEHDFLFVPSINQRSKNIILSVTSILKGF